MAKNTTIKRVVQQVDSVALQQQDQTLEDFSSTRQLPKPEVTPQRLYVAVDGTTVHETDGWHECKILKLTENIRRKTISNAISTN